MVYSSIQYLPGGNLYAWFSLLGLLFNLLLGPTQPFLAYNLNTDTQTINLVWTLGFLGFLVGSLIASHIFTRYLRTSLRKLMFMSSVMLLTGLATLCLPLTMNLPLLLMTRFIQVFIDTQKRQTIFSLVSRIWPFSDCRQCCVSIYTGT